MPRRQIGLSPETRSHIGRAGALARHHGADSELAQQAKRAAAVSRIGDHLRNLLNTSPPLMPEDQRELVALINSVGGGTR